MKKAGFLGSLLLPLLLPLVASAAVLGSQTITLVSGWNIVSTPMVLSSHSFSAAENSSNFDIYVLDALQTAGWATMAQLGQTEFTPLYGYFINNKTGTSQTLTFDYLASTTPNQRLFQRQFSTAGWYSFGVANPSYALTIGYATTTSVHNQSSILTALSGAYDTVIDLTDGLFSSDVRSVGVASSWTAATPSDVSSLHDFRETKGYAVHVSQANAIYNGYQNDELSNSPTAYTVSSDVVSRSDTSSNAAQNVSVNVPNQPLGGFVTSFSSEAVSISGMTIAVASSSVSGGPLTRVTLVDENGAVVAGPVDENGSGNLVFTDSVTFPTGTHTYHVRGKVASNTSNSATLTLNIDPSNWTFPTGQTTGRSVDLSGVASFDLNTMTAKTASASITLSSSPASQNIIAGASGFTFANINIDASSSGEDVRMSSLKVSFVGSASDLSACQLYDGSTALNTGSNVLNSLSTNSANTFTLDNSLTVSKGTVKTLALKCNISSGTQNGNTYTFGVDSTYDYSATGVTSGTSFTPTVTTASGGTMTIASGSLTATIDASSPSYKLAAAGQTGVTMGVVKFHATNEAMNLNKLGLTLSNGTYGSKATGAGGSASGAGDVVQAYIYNGSTLVGTAIFSGSNTTATSTLSTPVTLAKDSDTTLTLKADLASIGTSASGGIGDVIKLDPLNVQAVGQSSGTAVNAGATAGVAGVQLYKTYPTVSNAGASCTNSNACNGTAQVLKKFTVTANSSGSLGLYQISASVATSSASVTNLKLFAYTDSGYSSPASVSGTTGGQFGTTQTPNANSYTSVFTQTSPLQVAAGTTLYFAITGDVTPDNSATTWAVSTTVLGDSAATAAPAGYNVNTASSVSPANFVWSDNATTTASQTDVDWTNGYAVSGLPASGF